MDKYAVRLSPYVSETIWGGRKLIDNFNVKTEKANAAEGWMLSCLVNGPSVVTNGCYEGENLYSVLEKEQDWAGTHSTSFREFPVLIKFIDAMDNLSVQVHPTKSYCESSGKGRSKTECWYIIDCEDDAQLLLGFKDKITTEEFKMSIEDGTLTEYVSSVKVKPGDFFFIEAGTLHAICKGVLLAEVQESSDTTYRIFDYNRLGKDGKPRELHINDAINVTKLDKFVQPDFCPENIFVNGKKLLVKCDCFTVFHYTVQDNFCDSANDDSFVSLLVLSGDGKLTSCDETMDISKGDSIFIPAGSGSYHICGNAEIIETRI